MHHYCPKGAASWCGWQQDRKNYKHHNVLPAAVFQEIKPIFHCLADKKQLKRCAKGLTQNANESINGLIWQLCPKERFVGVETIETAVALAVCKFNDGAYSLKKLFDHMRLRDGHFTNLSLWSQDQARVRKSDYHSSETVKRGEGTREKDLKTCRERLKEKHTLRGTFESMYSVILHYSKCYCALLLTDVCCFLFFFFSSLSQHDSVCNYYVVQLQTSVVFVFSLSLHTLHITINRCFYSGLLHQWGY